MSLELFQGFDYSTDADLVAEGYLFGSSGSHLLTSTAARYAGGQGLKLDSTSASVYLIARNSSLPAVTSSAVKIYGFAFFLASGFPTNPVHLGQIVNSGSSVGVFVDINTNGSITLKNSVGSITQTSATGLIVANTWYYIEVKAAASAASLQLNGSALLSLTGLTMSAFDRIDIGDNASNTTGIILYADDLYICNGNGTTQNDFLGPCRVQTLTPSGAGNYSQWTPNGAVADWQCVKETTEDGDTTYVSDGTAGHRDSYTHGALTGTINAIIAVDDLVYAKTDPSATGTHTLASSQRIGSTDYDNPTPTLTTAYAYYHDIRTTSPATAAAYTTSEVNAMEMGLKNVSG